MKPSRKPGFSLTELLVVVAIIGLMLVLIPMATSESRQAKALDGGMSMVSSLVSSTRAEAMSRGLGAKLIIDNGADPATRLRRMAIIRYEGMDPLSAEPVLASRPTMLPDGVFFSIDEVLPGLGSTGFDIEQHSFTRNQQDGQTDCLVYEFNGRGHVETPGSLFFVRGIMDPTNSTLQVTDEMQAGIRGFRLPVNGRPIFFETREQIEIAATE